MILIIINWRITIEAHPATQWQTCFYVDKFIYSVLWRDVQRSFSKVLFLGWHLLKVFASSGSITTNMIILGGMDMSSTLLLILLSPRVARKNLVATTFVITGIFLLIRKRLKAFGIARFFRFDISLRPQKVDWVKNTSQVVCWRWLAARLESLQSQWTSLCFICTLASCIQHPADLLVSRYVQDLQDSLLLACLI